MDNLVYKMMLTNAKNYLANIDYEDKYFGNNLTAFDITSALAICLAKQPEDVMIDLALIGDQ